MDDRSKSVYSHCMYVSLAGVSSYQYRQGISERRSPFQRAISWILYNMYYFILWDTRNPLSLWIYTCTISPYSILRNPQSVIPLILLTHRPLSPYCSILHVISCNPTSHILYPCNRWEGLWSIISNLRTITTPSALINPYYTYPMEIRS